MEEESKGQTEASPFLQFLPVSKSEACFGAVYEAKQGSGLPEVEVRNSNYTLKIITSNNNWPKIGIEIESQQSSSTKL